MMAPNRFAGVALFAGFIAPIFGQQTSICSKTLAPKNSIRPTVASGYRMALVATGLTKPRSMQFDTAGNLLVVQSGAGISNLAFQDDGGTCLSVKSQRVVVESNDVGPHLLRALVAR